MTVTDDLDPFVGRAAEVGVLRSEVAAIRSGMPRIVIVQGDAGAGKTTLIENVVAAEVDLTVLWTSGEAWEVSVANGVVDQLMCVAGLDVARPTAIQYRGAPEEPNVLGARILDVLTGLERAAPVVVIVDDAQWADIGSLRALLFAARRLAKQRLLMMFGQRTEDAHRLPAGLRRLACGRTGTTLTLGPRPAAAAHRSDVGDPSVRSGRRPPRPTADIAPGIRRRAPRRPSPRTCGAVSTPAAIRPRPSSKRSSCWAPPIRRRRASWLVCPTWPPRWARPHPPNCCTCAATSASTRSTSPTRSWPPLSTSRSGPPGCNCTRR